MKKVLLIVITLPLLVFLAWFIIDSLSDKRPHEKEGRTGVAPQKQAALPSADTNALSDTSAPVKGGPLSPLAVTAAQQGMTSNGASALQASAKTDATPSLSNEMDRTANPYAAALREPGKSKRKWDADYIGQFQSAKAGDPVRFELTEGVMAEGAVKIIQLAEDKVTYVSGELTAPEPGSFFFLRPPAGGKAGTAVGVVEFPASKTAYRIEPTGTGGTPELWQRRLDEVICLEMPKAEPIAMQALTNETANMPPLRPDLVPDFLPSYNADNHGNAIVSLQSFPGSPAVLLLDFFGGYTPSWGGITYDGPNVGNDAIKDIWKRVAEDYMPFNINVTTDLKVYQAAPAASRQRCCFTYNGATTVGVAYFGSWNWGNDVPCWSAYCTGKAGAEVGAHEPGHTLGLGHSGQDVPDGAGGTTHVEYYAGQGGGATGWCPIMGAAYYQNVTSFSKGDYSYASSLQDQLANIVTANNNVAYRTDDTGSTLATSRYVEVYTNSPAFAEGVIERAADTDAFQFTTTGGTVSLTATPVGDWADLALLATLADAAGTVLASNSPQAVLSASIATNLPAGTYTFRVTGAGRGDPLATGFSSYASLGYYSIAGSVAGARVPTRLSVLEHAANSSVVGTVTANNPNGSPLTYAITSGNTGGTFSVDSSGVVRVANNTLLDYTTLAKSTLLAVQFEVFMTITNVNNPALTEVNRRVVIAVQQVYPLVPWQLTATANSSLRISLTWPESLGATRYNVKRSQVHGGPYTTVASPGNPSYTDGGLANGVTYYYVVSAVNANGESGNSPEASATAQAVANFGFEAPGIGSGNHAYNPAGGFWTFGGSAGNGSGLVANGSAFGNPNAPEGGQAAFVQSYGVISQVLSGFTPGATYTITYSAAQRTGNSGGESWNVKIDNSVVQVNSPGGTGYANYTATFVATSTAHTLSFVGTDLAGGDNTVFLDDVRVALVLPDFANASFELPSLGGSNHQYNPSGSSWTFTGASPSGSGIAANGSAFNNPNAPDGVQAAFVQAFGTLSRTLSGFVPGALYTIRYSAAQRPGESQHGGESWNVKIDNTVIQTNNPGGTSYADYAATFVATAAAHTLSFVGTDLAGGDNTVFLDNVSIASTLQPVTPSVALSSPSSNDVFVIPGTVSLAASVTANGNPINRVQFFTSYPGTLIGEVAQAPYTFAWTSVGAGGRTYSVFARVIFNDTSSADSAPVTFTVINRNPDFGFEIPGIGSGNHAYNPIGGSWLFSGQSGIVANGSGFFNPDAPEGSQAAFVQSYGSLAQTLSGFAPGTRYTLTYAAAQRSGAYQNGGESWDVMIDDAVIQANSPGGTGYTPCTATFVASAGTHTLRFVGTDLAGGDNTVFIDNVAINPPIAAPVVTADTLPATAADVVGGDVTFTAAFAGYSPIGYQWQKVSGGATNNVVGATNTTLTLTNLQLANTGAYRLLASNALGVAVSSASVLTVSSVPAAVNNVITAFAAQTGLGNGSAFTPTWAVAAGSLIQGQSPGSATGDFNLEPYWGARSVNALTAGDGLTISAGGSPATTSTNYVTCGNGGGAGASVVYALTNSTSVYNLTNITVYAGWRDAGRDQQAYTVSYSTVAAPSTYIPIASVSYNPANAAGTPSATRATLTPATGWLATNVAAVKFDFTVPASENGFCGYAEIGLFGVPVNPQVTTNTLPVTAADVVGGEVTFTAGIGGLSPIAYQWQVIRGGATNTLSGATNATLRLTNLQLTDTGSYRLRASNAYGVAVSAPGSLTVSSVPAAVNNIITKVAAQTGFGPAGLIGATFTPTWSMATNNSLIAGQSPGSASGNFTKEAPGRGVPSLTAGGSGEITVVNAIDGFTTSTNYVTCGDGGGAGATVVYSLTGSATGYTLTNITVYGGWSDAGRDQQAYTIYYSTIAAPATFIPLSSVSYNPANAANAQSATRVTLIPATGQLAANVAAVKFDFTSPASENGYCGYSGIALFGAPAQAGVPPSTHPTNILVQLTANRLTLSWPDDHIGWRLQSKTNLLDATWMDVEGSTATNLMLIPINGSSGSAFFRLTYP